MSKLRTLDNRTSVWAVAMMQYGSTRSVLIKIFYVKLIISKIGWYPPPLPPLSSVFCTNRMHQAVPGKEPRSLDLKPAAKSLYQLSYELDTYRY